jgi:hypothetical protein
MTMYRLVLSAAAQNIRDSEETFVCSISRKKQVLRKPTIFTGKTVPQLKIVLDESAFIIQGDSNMTETDLQLFTHKSVPVIFESPGIIHRSFHLFSFLAPFLVIAR